jgi:hypothetical protein
MNYKNVGIFMGLLLMHIIVLFWHLHMEAEENYRSPQLREIYPRYLLPLYHPTNFERLKTLNEDHESYFVN